MKGRYEKRELMDMIEYIQHVGLERIRRIVKIRKYQDKAFFGQDFVEVMEFCYNLKMLRSTDKAIKIFTDFVRDIWNDEWLWSDLPIKTFSIQKKSKILKTLAAVYREDTKQEIWFICRYLIGKMPILKLLDIEEEAAYSYCCLLNEGMIVQDSSIDLKEIKRTIQSGKDMLSVRLLKELKKAGMRMQSDEVVQMVERLLWRND